MTDDNDILNVVIFGTEYPLRVHSKAEYVKKVAAYVDKKMNEISESKPERTPYQIAILAALNIADELMSGEEKEHETEINYERQVQKLSDMLEIGIKRAMEATLE